MSDSNAHVAPSQAPQETFAIPLSRGIFAIVDNCDADLATVKWCCQSREKHYAVRDSGNGKRYRLHRIIMERILGRDLEPFEYVDHKNGIVTDNRRVNLRIATVAQNNRNQRIASHNTSGFKGVTFNKASGKWKAQIKVNGHVHYLGLFSSPEEASEAYDRAALTVHGEYARTNSSIRLSNDK